jgi:hypothetical protein
VNEDTPRGLANPFRLGSQPQPQADYTYSDLDVSNMPVSAQAMGVTSKVWHQTYMAIPAQLSRPSLFGPGAYPLPTSEARGFTGRFRASTVQENASGPVQLAARKSSPADVGAGGRTAGDAPSTSSPLPGSSPPCNDTPDESPGRVPLGVSCPSAPVNTAMLGRS